MRRGYAIPAVAVVVGGLALAWWTPWESGTVPVIALARKAFGDRPVVHVLARAASSPRSIAAGDGIEIWSQGTRRIHVVLRRAGKVVTDDVEDPPLEPPDVSAIAAPALLFVFVTSYRSDLVGGRFRVASEESIEGRKVIWIGSENLGVAIDPTSYQPLWLSDSPPPFGTALIHLITAETIPYNPVDFVLLRNRKPRHL